MARNSSKGKNYQTLSNETEEDVFSSQETTPPTRQGNLLWKSAFPSGFMFEIKRLLVLAIPVIFTNLFQFIIPTESITICGHLSTSALNGVALANSMINAFGISISTGLCTACDTLFSQAYGGLDKKQVGIFLQRSIIINSLCIIGLWCLHFNMLPIFIGLGQIPEVAEIADTYMKIFAPGLLFQVNYLMLARYLQNQEKVYPPLIIGAFANIFNIVAQYIAVHVIGYGYEASAVIQAFTYFIMWILELIYILSRKIYIETWDGWGKLSLYDWGHFLKLAIPGVGHVALEEILWEICVFIAGTLGAVELATQSILFQSELFGYMIPVGVGVAVNIRVGQYLGGNNSKGAKTCVNVAIVLIICLMSILVVFLMSFSQFIPLLFTDDQNIVDSAVRLFPLLALTFLIDGFLGVSNGALRGCGRQQFGAVTIFVGYYIVGFPLALVLVFAAKLSLLGIWIGMIVGLVIMTIANSFALFRTDWDLQAELALLRMKSSPVKEDIDIPPIVPFSPDEPNMPPGLKQHLLLKKTHIRTSSHPVGCSTDSVKLPPTKRFISTAEFTQMCRRRLLQLIPLLILFISAMILSASLPKSAYWPDIDTTNFTTSSPETSPTPFYSTIVTPT